MAPVAATRARACRCRRWPAGLPAALLALALPAGAAQIDSADFFKLQRGMNESELLIRAGQPDLITYPGVVARETTIGGTVVDDAGNTSALRYRRTDIPQVKQYHYIPDKSEHDPFLTVITVRGGLVTRIDRTKVFSRDHLPDPPGRSGTASEPVRSDIDIQRDRADRTYQAAQDYTATRERLLEEAADAPADHGRRVYRQVGEDGSVYYGDSPTAPDPVLQ